jgi:hypothetical protein
MTASTEDMADRWGLNPAQFWLRGRHPSAPVAYDEATGFWNVYGHPEIIEMFTDPKTFSSNTGRVLPKDMSGAEAGALTEGNLINIDPPDHTKLRKLVSHAFTPKNRASPASPTSCSTPPPAVTAWSSWPTWRTRFR